MDVHRAYFDLQAKPNTYVEVPEEDQPKQGKVCGCLVHTMYGTIQAAASAWLEEVEQVMRQVNIDPGASSPCVFHRSDVDGLGLVHGGDSVIATRRWHAKEVVQHSRSKWDLEVQTFCPGDYGGKQETTS